MTVTPDARILLVGPNGAGKTTLLKLIMGLEIPDAGEIRAVPGARIGYLPQEPETLDLHKTVIEIHRYGQVGYEGEFIGTISHDRWFMQRFGGEVWELAKGKIVRKA